MREDYLSEFEDYALCLKSRYPSVRKVYLVGNCGAPGVSDIDTLVVLKNQTNRWIWGALPVSQYSYSHIFHGPFFTSEEYLPRLVQATTLKINCEVGDGVGLVLPDRPVVRDWQLDIVRTSFFLWHFNQRTDDIIKFSSTSKRYFLLVTNSFSYTLNSILDMCKYFGVDATDSIILSDYAILVKKARDLWVNDDLRNADSCISRIAHCHPKVISIANEMLNMVISHQYKPSSQNHLFSSVRNHVRLLTLAKLGGIAEIADDIYFPPDLLEAMNLFSADIAVHVDLYRRRNLESYGAEFPLPGLDINRTPNLKVSVLSKLIRKMPGASNF